MAGVEGLFSITQQLWMLATMSQTLPHVVELSLQKPTRAPVEKFHPLETEGQVDSKLHLELDAKFQSALS